MFQDGEEGQCGCAQSMTHLRDSGVGGQMTRPVKRSDGARHEETQRIGSDESVLQDDDSSDAGGEEDESLAV